MKRTAGELYSLPIALWLGLFLLVPIAIIFLYSFMTKGMYGGIEWRFSLSSYFALFNPLFLQVTLSTLFIAALSSLGMVLLALPTAYFMARSRFKTVLLILIIIPFWTNFLIRVYAWIAILGNNGFLNEFLLNTGVITEHIQFLYNKWAVILVTIYTYLPFAVLPLYSTIEKFDFSLLEAAQDLGATRHQSVMKVLLPNIRAGITTAVLFTFIPAFGNYAIPQILGGKDSLLLGTIIARELTIARNWPLASSISMVLTVMTTIAVMLFMKFNKNSSTELEQARISESNGGER